MKNCSQHGSEAITANGRCASCDAETLEYAASAEFRSRAPEGVRTWDMLDCLGSIG